LLAFSIILCYSFYNKNSVFSGRKGGKEMEETEEICTEEQVNAILEKLEQQTKKEAFRIIVNKKKKPKLYDSKFGGVPYWDKKQAYPTDSDGNKLILLAQINLNQIEPNELLPQTGMLQFFIANNDMYGVDFDKPDQQNGFRVIYHESIDESVTREEVLESGIPFSGDSEGNGINGIERPIDGELAVDIKKREISMGIDGDYRFEGLFSKAAKEMKISAEYRDLDLSDILGEDSYDEQAAKNAGHWLLGYPHFTQWDPREWKEKLQYYDTLLFQMDSEYCDEDDDPEVEIMWGDAGVANFFINEEDLKKKDFSKVMYTWDCC